MATGETDVIEIIGKYLKNFLITLLIGFNLIIRLFYRFLFMILLLFDKIDIFVINSINPSVKLIDPSVSFGCFIFYRIS